MWSRATGAALSVVAAALILGGPAWLSAQDGAGLAQDPEGIWTMTTAPAVPLSGSIRARIHGLHVVVTLDRAALMAALAHAPLEDARGGTAGREAMVRLPMPDATFGRFLVVESPILAPALAAQFPEIKTYLGKGIDDPTASVRFDWTADGFHALVSRQGGPVVIDPEFPGDRTAYVSYRKADYLRPKP